MPGRLLSDLWRPSRSSLLFQPADDTGQESRFIVGENRLVLKQFLRTP
jgi:hypothetical protein